MAELAKLEWVSSHREAVGREPFAELTTEECARHEALIEKHAPYGNDPWGEE